MKTKKLLSILSLIIAAAVIFSSCGLIIINDIPADTTRESDSESAAESGENPDLQKDGYKEYETKENNREYAEEFLDSLPVRDYEGATFFITTPNADYISPREIDDSVSKLVYERNRDVGKRLNITIATSTVSSESMLAEMKQSIASGTYFTDLLMVPIYTVGQFQAADTLANMRKIPFFDLDAPYFYSESSAMTSGGYSTFAIAGDASISPNSYSAMYFSKNVLYEAGFDADDLYSTVLKGEWTYDKLLSMTEAVRVLETESGGYKTVMADSLSSRFADIVFKSYGLEFIKTAKRAVPVIGYTPEKAKPAMDTLYKMYSDPSASLTGGNDAISLFSNGEAAFLADYLSAMEKLSSSYADWGVLPIPKGEGEKEYKTLVSNSENVFAIPKNHTNSEYAAIVLSALNAASYGYIHDEYVNYSMTHLLRDNDSVNMLDLILDTTTFDFALAFGTAYPEIANATYKLVRKSAPLGNLEDEYSALVDSAADVMRKNFNLRY